MICVVEDDQPVRESLVTLLEVCGFATIGFQSAEEALANQWSDKIECLIVDVRLPGKSGIELLRHLASRGIVVPTIVITGHGDEATIDQLKDLSAIRFMEKPFDPPALLNSVREMLEPAG